MIEVVPCVALPPGTRQLFTYRVPPGTDAPVGALVRIPFGSRTVDGVVWRKSLTALKQHVVKNIEDVVSPRLLTHRETIFLERLAELSLESLALLTKSLVSVRRPMGALPDFPRSPREGRSPAVTLVHGVIPDAVLASLPDIGEGQVLMLVPELSLADSLHKAFRKSGIPTQRFAQTLSLTHRRTVLRELVAGASGVFIATHSGIFLPFPKLQSIVVVEPGLPAHRQWDLHPRYDARLAALLRAERDRVPTVFVSSLPSMDLQSLPVRRVTVRGSPPTLTGRILRRRIEEEPVLGDSAERTVRETLEHGHSVFLFQNVVGGERLYGCARCGFVFRCTVCGSVLHRVRGMLTCLSCGTIAGPMRSFCPQCGSPRVAPRRVGTAALAELLGKTFPHIPILRLDRESMPRQAQTARSLKAPSLVIGTERAFTVLTPKMFHLSVVVDGDQLLAVPAFDAAEAAMRIIARVAVLTAPPHEQTLTVQTAMPDFPLFQALAAGSLHVWIDAELATRKALTFPPFASVLTLTRDFRTRGRAETATLPLVERFGRRKGVRVGMRLTRVAKGFRSTVTLRGKRSTLWKALPFIPRSWSVDPLVPLRELL